MSTEKKNLKYIIMSVILIVLTICTVITGVHFFGNNSNDKAGKNSEVISVFAADKKADEPGCLSGDSTILLLCLDGDTKNIVFTALFDFRIYSENIVVSVIDSDAVVDGKTLREYYSYSGITDFVAAVEKDRSAPVDRYVVMDQDGFCSAVDKMGKVTFLVDEDYTYFSSDKSYNVVSGKNELDASMLYSYIKILSERPEYSSEISQIICSAVNTYLPTVDAENTERLFGSLCNCVTTDISVSDYWSAESDIKYLVSHDTKCIAKDNVNQ